ncbi:MAG: SLC13 family permease [Desulfobacterales bacterium]|nr:SLC13 family permease [Desulfobacterales bacterium]
MPLGGLGSREKGFQGESYYSTPNPPVAAVFTYHLKDAPKSLKDQRKEEEAALVKAGKPVPYPTRERLKAEQDQEPAVLLFTVADEDGQVVRVLREPARKGLNRAMWDLRYPALEPTSPAQASPASSGPSGTFVVPGAYSVSLASIIDGKITALAGPVKFEVKALAAVSLPAKDRTELAAFQKKVRKLSNSVNAASSAMARAGDARPALPGLAQERHGAPPGHPRGHQGPRDEARDAAAQDVRRPRPRAPRQGHLSRDRGPHRRRGRRHGRLDLGPDQDAARRVRHRRGGVPAGLRGAPGGSWPRTSRPSRRSSTPSARPTRRDACRIGDRRPMTAEIALTLAVLLATVLLFVFEVLRVDVIAVLVMLALAWLRLVTPAQAFSGLAGTAVVSMIAVMIMGAGIDRSGVMNRLIRPVMRDGRAERTQAHRHRLLRGRPGLGLHAEHRRGGPVPAGRHAHLQTAPACPSPVCSCPWGSPPSSAAP